MKESFLQESEKKIERERERKRERDIYIYRDRDRGEERRIQEMHGRCCFFHQTTHASSTYPCVSGSLKARRIFRISRISVPTEPGGWGMNLAFYCPEPYVAEKEGTAEAGQMADDGDDGEGMIRDDGDEKKNQGKV